MGRKKPAHAGIRNLSVAGGGVVHPSFLGLAVQGPQEKKEIPEHTPLIRVLGRGYRHPVRWQAIVHAESAVLTAGWPQTSLPARVGAPGGKFGPSRRKSSNSASKQSGA